MFDLLNVPIIGCFLRWRHASTVMRLPVLAVALAAIVHGLAGPQLAPKNLAIVLTWLHLRGLLVLGLLLAGNLFCMCRVHLGQPPWLVHGLCTPEPKIYSFEMIGSVKRQSSEPSAARTMNNLVSESKCTFTTCPM